MDFISRFLKAKVNSSTSSLFLSACYRQKERQREKKRHNHSYLQTFEANQINMFQPTPDSTHSYFMLMCNPLTCCSMMAVQWGHSSKQSKMCPAKRNHFIRRRMTHLYSIKEWEMHNKTLSQAPLSFSLPSVKPIAYSIPSQHQMLLFNSDANF